MFAIRGAVQVERDSPAAIAAAVARLCKEIARANRLSTEKIVSAIFTVTPDLVSGFPARAAREQGWSGVPMLGAQEIPVPGAPPRICRALVHARGRRKPRHIYLGRAGVLLRPDLPATPRSAGRRETPSRRASPGGRGSKTPSPRPSPRGRGSRDRRSSRA
jgi:chorismate mutase